MSEWKEHVRVEVPTPIITLSKSIETVRDATEAIQHLSNLIRQCQSNNMNWSTALTEVFKAIEENAEWMIDEIEAQPVVKSHDYTMDWCPECQRELKLDDPPYHGTCPSCTERHPLPRTVPK